MIKILSQRFSFPSARLLGNSLQTLVGQQVIVTSYPFRIKDKFIRYGNSESVNIKDTEFNPAQFIHLCSSKLAFSRLMESNDIYSPIYYNDPQKIERYPIVIRETLTSYGGRGISVEKRWLNFRSFLKDMGERPTGLSLDRKNVNGNYCRNMPKLSSFYFSCF